MSEFRVECPRCGIPLARVGRRDLHFGPMLRHDSRVNQLFTELFVCELCGHMEIFHPKIGAQGRSENPPFDASRVLDKEGDSQP